MSSSYRPIALLSSVSKVFERLVYNQLVRHCLDNDLLPDEQFGFLKGRSAEWQLLSLLQEWHSALDSRFCVHTVFLDAAKAFDRVDHTILLSHLAEIGVSGTSLSWFWSHLSGRRIRTRVDGAVSKPLQVTSGVPQGSVLGPLLYLLHVKDVPRRTEGGCALFADDTMLYRCGCTALRQLPCCPLEGDLQQLSVWAEENKVAFNASKSATLLVGGKSGRKFLQCLHVNNAPVPHKQSHRHLGVVLSESLRWDDHISHVLKLIAAPLALCKVLAYRHRLPPSCIRRFYCAFVRPRLEYCSAVWGGCCRKLQNRLEGVQLQAARAIVQLPHLGHKDLLFRSNLPSLGWRRKIHRLEVLWKLVNNQGPPQLQALLPRDAASRCHYSLRAAHSLEFPESSSSRTLGSFLGLSIPEWNSLPLEVVSAPSCSSFRSRACAFFAPDRFSLTV